MSDLDKQLITIAKRTPYTLWYTIDRLIIEAESAECREMLRAIQRKKREFEIEKNDKS